MITGEFYDQPELISVGVFMRGVLLGEFGFNNLVGGNSLSLLVRELCGGQLGHSLKSIEIGFMGTNVKIVDPNTGWDVLVKIYESRLLSGDDIQSVLAELTFSNAYQALTNPDAKAVVPVIQCFNSIFQHLVYFANAIAQNTVTQTPQ